MSIQKKITPYIKRAQELDKDTQNPDAGFIAYYFRYYAVDTGLNLAKDPKYGPAPQDVNAILLDLLGKLETDKKALPEHTPAEGCKKIFDFANRLFYRADQDKNCDKSTATFFYTNSLFYDILDQFDIEENGLSPEETLSIEYKRKFCKVRATEIISSIKKGETAQYISYDEYMSQTTGEGNELDVNDGEDEKKTTPTSEIGNDAPILPTIPTTIPQAPTVSSTSISNPLTGTNTELNIPEVPSDILPQGITHIPEAPFTPTIPKAPFTGGSRNNNPPSYNTVNPEVPSNYFDLSASSNTTSTNNTSTTVLPNTSTINTNVPVVPSTTASSNTSSTNNTSVPVAPLTSSNNTYVPVVPMASTSNTNVSVNQTLAASIPVGTTINRNIQAQIVDDCYFAVTAAKQFNAQKTEEFLLQALARLRSGN